MAANKFSLVTVSTNEFQEACNANCGWITGAGVYVVSADTKDIHTWYGPYTMENANKVLDALKIVQNMPRLQHSSEADIEDFVVVGYYSLEDLEQERGYQLADGLSKEVAERAAKNYCEQFDVVKISSAIGAYSQVFESDECEKRCRPRP